METLRDILELSDEELSNILEDGYDDLGLIANPTEEEQELQAEISTVGIGLDAIYTAVKFLLYKDEIYEEEAELLYTPEFEVFAKDQLHSLEQLYPDISTGELILQFYFDKSAELVPDNFRTLVLNISDGRLLMQLAAATHGLRDIINEPGILKKVKRNVLRDPINERLKQSINLIRPISSGDDFTLWYITNFMTEGCKNVHSASYCAQSALLSGKFDYFKKFKDAPSLKEFTTHLLAVVRKYNITQKQMSTLLLTLTSNINVNRSELSTLVSTYIRFLSREYVHSTEFLERIGTNSWLTTIAFNTLIATLSSKFSLQRHIELLIESYIDAFGQTKVQDRILTNIIRSNDVTFTPNAVKLLKTNLDDWNSIANALQKKLESLLKTTIKQKNKAYTNIGRDSLLKKIREYDELLKLI